MILANIKDCTACMACVDICSHQALSATIDANGYYKVLTNKNACVSCGLCSKICPILNPLNTIQDSSQPFAVWNNDSIFRAKSASGGAFSAVALTILERGGVVYGAAISGFKIIHRRITSTGELIDLLGSKYQQSETVGVYRQVRQDLKDGKIVLFSGMACQIAGLISFLRNTDCRKLYTIQLIPFVVEYRPCFPCYHWKRVENTFQSILFETKKLLVDGEVEALNMPCKCKIEKDLSKIWVWIIWS